MPQGGPSKPKSHEERLNELRMGTMGLMKALDASMKKLETEILTTGDEAKKIVLKSQLETAQKRRQGYLKDLEDLGYHVGQINL